MNHKEVAAICKALADENRLKILELLSQGEKCGCELLAVLAISQPTLSFHMKVLATCGLVKADKKGKWCHYSLNCQQFKTYKEYLASITCKKENKDEY